MNTRFFFLAALMVILTGTAWIVAHQISMELNLSQLAFWRTLGVFIAVSVFNLLVPKVRVSLHLARSKWRPILALSMLGFALYFCFSYAALRLIGPTEVGMIMTLIPALTYLILLMFFQERTVLRKWLGLILATASAILFIGKNQANPLSNLLGSGLAFLAAASFALYGIFFKKYLHGLAVIGIMPYLTLPAIVILFLVALPQQPDLTSADHATLARVLFLGAGLTAPVYLLYLKILELRGPVAVNTLALLTPFSVLGIQLIAGDRKTIVPLEVISLTSCMLGIYMIVIPEDKKWMGLL